jgi:hypothetical protein
MDLSVNILLPHYNIQIQKYNILITHYYIQKHTYVAKTIKIMKQYVVIII